MNKQEQPSIPVLIDEQRIRQRVEELALEISVDYEERGEVVLIGVLRGAFIFLADLSRRLTVPTQIDFVAASSYGEGTVSSGDVKFPLNVRLDIKGKHVLIVEDIADTGETLKILLKRLRKSEPASLNVCTLLRKPKFFDVDISVKYVGFDIPDVWVLGYGLDLAGRFRSLPYVGVVDAAFAQE